jgi:hypothetical protein
MFLQISGCAMSPKKKWADQPPAPRRHRWGSRNLRPRLRFDGVAVLFLAIIAGCATPAAKRFIDVQPSASSQDVQLTVVSDQRLRLRARQNLAPAFLASVRAEIIAGGVYLFPTRISSGLSREEFDVPLQGLSLPSGWRDHIYWVDGEEFPSPLNPWAERVHVIKRRRLSLDTRRGGNTKS